MALERHEKEKREGAVIETCQGIQPMFEAFYLEALAYAAGRADAAFDRFSEALGTDRTGAEIVATVHEALAHAAALSRFFWPAGNAGALAAARATKLRAAFGLSESSALYGRDLRNALEHFDERLDQYLLEDHVGYFFPSPIVGDSRMAEDQLGHIFRLVDPDREVFVLLGQSYEFGPIRQEILDVMKNAREMSDAGSRLRAST